jgi:hypothetical protein
MWKRFYKISLLASFLKRGRCDNRRIVMALKASKKDGNAADDAVIRSTAKITDAD